MKRRYLPTWNPVFPGWRSILVRIHTGTSYPVHIHGMYVHKTIWRRHKASGGSFYRMPSGQTNNLSPGVFSYLCCWNIKRWKSGEVAGWLQEVGMLWTGSVVKYEWKEGRENRTGQGKGVLDPQTFNQAGAIGSRVYWWPHVNGPLLEHGPRFYFYKYVLYTLAFMSAVFTMS